MLAPVVAVLHCPPAKYLQLFEHFFLVTHFPFSQTSYVTRAFMVVIVGYLLLMRPEQKRRKEMEELLANIKKNDKIILGSGICGTVVNAEPKSMYVTIRVDESTNTKLRVLRSAIIRVGQPDETAADGKEAG